jgi:hypothetical protein
MEEQSRTVDPLGEEFTEEVNELEETQMLS